MPARAWLTPDDAPEPYTCKALRFPDSLEWQAIVEGALLNLAEPENWEQFGALTPEQAAEIGLKIYSLFACETGGCDMTPIGSIIAWPSEQIPEGWEICTGTWLKVADYPELFAVIGYKFGSGGGGEYLILPSLVDRYVKGTIGGAEFGTVVGDNERTLTVANMPAHDHQYWRPGTPGTPILVAPGALPANSAATMFATWPTGGDERFDNRPESLALFWIIRVK